MKKSFIVFALVAVVALGVGAPSSSFAQVPSTTQAQLDIIANIAKQIQALQQQLASLQQQQQTAVAQLVQSLKVGSEGDQVKVLQALLAANPDIYPEGLITGFFGQATSRAVARFQKKNGIEQLGIVGPKTLKKLNEFLNQNPIKFESTNATTGTVGVAKNDDDDDDKENNRGGKKEKERENEGRGRLCAMVPPGHLIAPGWLRKNGGVAPLIPICQNLPEGIAKKIGWTIPTTTPTSTPDTTAPVLSSVSTSGVTTNSVSVQWLTNEVANTQVVYGLTSAYGSSTTLNSTLIISHSAALSELLSGTVYHFAVRSADNAGNVSTSSDMTFTTVAADTTAPVISAINASMASATGTVSWTTDEAATGKIYYSLFSPINTASTGTVLQSTSSLTIAHSFALMGLTASTTYYYMVESADASANLATSSAQSFLTTQ